jgi:hypothetical protein
MRRRATASSWWGPILALALAAGCAAPDFAVAPGYRAARPAPLGEEGLAVIALEVKDSRGRRGEEREGGGEVLAGGNKGSIYIETPCEEIVREGLEAALRAQGFQIAGGAPVIVEAELRRLVLDARDFTDWPLDPETGSTLDVVRVFVPRKLRGTRAELDLFVRIHKAGWAAGFSHLAQKEAAGKDSNRAVVEATLSQALTEAIDEIAAKASLDIPRASALPVTDADFRARDQAIGERQRETEALRAQFEKRQLALDDERREVLRAREMLEKENRELAANLGEKLSRLEGRETENRKTHEQLEAERARLAAERAELERWKETLRANAEAQPPPAVSEKRPPVIVMTSPAGGERVTTRGSVRIEGVAFSNVGVENVEYVVNGRPLGAERAVGGRRRERSEANHLQFSRELTLMDGRNAVLVRAIDADGASAEEEILVVHEKPRGQIHIVAIGIDRYRDSEVPPLKFAVKDARAVVTALEGALGLAPGRNVELLADEEATAREVRLALGTRLLARESREDTVFIYFSGHGGLAPNSSYKDGTEKYLLPVDADPSDYPATAVSMEEVGRIFDRLESERVVFFADTCYSGAAGGRTVKPRGRDFRALPSESVEERLQGAGRVILSASGASEVAQEMDDIGQGVFTYYLLRALGIGEADADGNGELEIREVYDYVRARVREKTGGTQNPGMSGTGGEIVIHIAR